MFKLMMLILIAVELQIAYADRPVRACDSYIKQYCSQSDDKGPGCLKGHENDVSDACKADMERGPRPPEGQGPQSGNPPPRDPAGQFSGDSSS